MINDILTIDPGFHTGYAYWTGNNDPITGCFNLSRGKKVVTIEDQLNDMWLKFSALIKTLEPVGCIIESVEHWGGSLKSRTASSKGDLSKLSYLIGGYSYICSKKGISFKLVPAKTWKGQLPNSALVGRVKMINGKEYPNDHILCAVGIGFAEEGLLKWK